MPIVAPPPSGQTYADSLQGLQFEVVPDPAAGSDGLRVAHDVQQSGGPSPLPLIAVAKGRVTFIPAGQTATVLPTPGDLSVTAPGSAGALFLQLLPAEAAHIASHLAPIGVAPYAHVVYRHVEKQSVESAFETILDDHVANNRIPRKELERVAGVTGLSLADLKQQYLAAFMAGNVSLLTLAGQDIGEAQQVNPADPSSQRACVLRYYSDKLGEEVQQPTPHSVVHPPEEVSPLLPLRNMPAYSDGSSPQTNVWDGHPLIAQLRDQEVPVEAHLRFVVFDIGAGQRVPLPAGIDVTLMVDDLGTDTEVAREQTDASGTVHFEIADFEDRAGEDPDIYFVVNGQGISHAGHTLPDEWSTQGWLATDDSTPGSYESFAGSRLGFEGSPVVFHVGVELHLAFEYEVDPSNRESTPTIPLNPIKNDPFPFPEGVFVTIVSGLITSQDEQVDEKGEIHTVLFDVDADTTVSFRMLGFEIEDPTINLRRAEATDPLDPVSTMLRWESRTSSTDQAFYPLQSRTHIGSASTPETVALTHERFRAALYLFKNLREWSTLLHHLTGGAWPGIELTIGLRAPAAAFSWPVGRINIPGTVGVGSTYGYSSYWDRSTHFHELSHQIVWKQSSLGSVDVGARYLNPSSDAYSMTHYSNLNANPGHAFVEGWPAFVEALAASTESPPYRPRRPTDPLRANGSTAGSLGPVSGNASTFNTGFSVEGAFANAVYLVFQRALDGVAGVPALNPHHDTLVPETVDGDVAASAPWITQPSARQRFMDFIYDTLGQFPDDEPTTRQYLENVGTAVRSDSAVDWAEVLADIRTMNMFTAPPQVTRISPDAGPVGGGQTAVIAGDFFVSNPGTSGPRNTDVEVDGQPAASVTVVDTETLEVTPPVVPASRHGAVVDVTVTTPAGDATLAGSYTYAASPTVASVSPAQAPRAGGQMLTIQGSNFLAGRTEVFIGSLGASLVNVGPSQITAQVPAAPPTMVGSAHDVDVVTPGGSARQPSAFTYTS